MTEVPPAGRHVAAFDFDGTLTDRDSLLPFVRFALGAVRTLGALGRSAPALAGHVAGLVPNWAAKESLLRAAFGGLAEDELAAAGERFARTALRGLVRPAALRAVAWHRERGHRLVLVSASLEAYLAPWGSAAGFDDVLATRLESLGGRITGRLLGGNCYGPEKVARLAALLDDLDGHIIHAYGDSRGDRELLAVAARPHYRDLDPERSR